MIESIRGRNSGLHDSQIPGDSVQVGSSSRNRSQTLETAPISSQASFCRNLMWNRFKGRLGAGFVFQL